MQRGKTAFPVWAGVGGDGSPHEPAISLAVHVVIACCYERGPRNLIERIAALPKAGQEEVVRSVVEIEQRHTGVYQLDDEERADLLEALAEIGRGDVADDDEAAALFKRLGA